VHHLVEGAPQQPAYPSISCIQLDQFLDVGLNPALILAHADKICAYEFAILLDFAMNRCSRLAYQVAVMQLLHHPLERQRNE